MSGRARILVVEDDRALADTLASELGAAGYEAVAARTGAEGAFLAEEERFDLILLDLNLPDGDGIEVAERLHERVEAPIVMLTARADLESRVEGLYAGASDYLVKPVHVRELIARVHARLRERGGDGGPRIGRLELLPASCAFRALGGPGEGPGEPVVLPELEYRLLETLARAPGRLFSRDDLERVLYGSERPASNTVEVFVSNLRRRLRAAGAGEPIRTVRGRGYMVR